MKKLTLNLDTLRVQSFATVEYVRVPGTVHAAQNTGPTYCTCDRCPSNYITCAITCIPSCDIASCQTCDTCESCQSCWETCQRTCYTGRCACYQEP